MRKDGDGSHELHIVKLPEDAGVEVVLRKRSWQLAEHLHASALVVLATLAAGCLLPLPSLVAFLLKSAVYALPFADAQAIASSIGAAFANKAADAALRLLFAVGLARLAAPTPVVQESVLALQGLGVQLTTKRLGPPALLQIPAVLFSGARRAELADAALRCLEPTLLQGAAAPPSQWPPVGLTAPPPQVDFVDAASIRSVVVNEGIQSCRVFYYLALVVRGRRTLVHCFPAACPRVAVLAPAYRALHATLCPDVAAATAQTDAVLGEAALAAEEAAAR